MGHDGRIHRLGAVVHFLNVATNSLTSSAEVVQVSAAVADHDSLLVIVDKEMDPQKTWFFTSDFDVRDDLDCAAFTNVLPELHEFLVPFGASSFGHAEIESGLFPEDPLQVDIFIRSVEQQGMQDRRHYVKALPSKFNQIPPLSSVDLSPRGVKTSSTGNNC